MASKIKPKDVVAILTLVFAFLFKLKGFDGSLDSIITLVLGYYFVKRADGYDKGI